MTTYYLLTTDTLNSLLLFMGILFASGIACEWMPEKSETRDIKYVYQFVAYIANFMLGVLLGAELIAGNVVESNITEQFWPLGLCLICWGVLSFIVLAVSMSRVIVKPYMRV